MQPLARSNTRKYYTGSTLIEIAIATGVLVVGLLSVYLSLVQVNRIAVRNEATAVALNVLSSQIDLDSTKSYNNADFTPAPKTDTFSFPDLPSGSITREVTEDPAIGVKTLTYTMSWTGLGGNKTISASYQLIDDGLNNCRLADNLYNEFGDPETIVCQ